LGGFYPTTLDKVVYTAIVAVDVADAVLAQVQSFSAEPSTFQVSRLGGGNRVFLWKN